MQIRRDLQPGDIYKHFKKKLYQIIVVAINSETDEKMVVYQALYGDFQVYVRTYDMFMSEVDHIKYPDVKQKYRFEYVDRKTMLQVENVNEKVNTCSDVNDDDLSAVDSRLMAFLDADTYYQKYMILMEMKDKIDDKIIDDMAVAMDVVIPEGELSDRYEALKNCVNTFRKFDCGDRFQR